MPEMHAQGYRAMPRRKKRERLYSKGVLITMPIPCPKPVRKKREYKRPSIKELVPLEETEQATVIEWLKLHNVLFSANVPDRRYCKRMGYSPGLPDLMIFQRPPAYNGQFVGCAIELKRRKGGIVSPEQREWLEKLQKQDWVAVVCAGAEEAIDVLETCGYGKRN